MHESPHVGTCMLHSFQHAATLVRVITFSLTSPVRHSTVPFQQSDVLCPMQCCAVRILPLKSDHWFAGDPVCRYAPHTSTQLVGKLTRSVYRALPRGLSGTPCRLVRDTLEPGQGARTHTSGGQDGQRRTEKETGKQHSSTKVILPSSVHRDGTLLFCALKWVVLVSLQRKHR